MRTDAPAQGLDSERHGSLLHDLSKGAEQFCVAEQAGTIPLAQDFVRDLYLVSGGEVELKKRAEFVQSSCEEGTDYHKAWTAAAKFYARRRDELANLQLSPVSRAAQQLARQVPWDKNPAGELVPSDTMVPAYLSGPLSLDSLRSLLSTVIGGERASKVFFVVTKIQGEILFVPHIGAVINAPLDEERKLLEAWRAEIRRIKEEAGRREVDGCFHLWDLVANDETEDGSVAKAALKGKAWRDYRATIHKGMVSMAHWLREQAAAAQQGLAMQPPQAAAMAAIPHSKKYLFGWPEILDAIRRPDTDKDHVARLSSERDGPITTKKGGKPRVELSRLVKWWNGLEEQWEANAEREKNNSRAKRLETHAHGRDAIVAPEISGGVRKNRDSAKKPRKS